MSWFPRKRRPPTEGAKALTQASSPSRRYLQAYDRYSTTKPSTLEAYEVPQVQEAHIRSLERTRAHLQAKLVGFAGAPTVSLLTLSASYSWHDWSPWSLLFLGVALIAPWPALSKYKAPVASLSCELQALRGPVRLPERTVHAWQDVRRVVATLSKKDLPPATKDALEELRSTAEDRVKELISLKDDSWLSYDRHTANLQVVTIAARLWEFQDLIRLKEEELKKLEHFKPAVEALPLDEHSWAVTALKAEVEALQRLNDEAL